MASARGNVLFKEGKVREALEAYREAIAATAASSKGPQDKETLANLFSNAALCLIKLEELAEASKICKEGLAVDAKHTKMNFRLAEAALLSGDGESIAEAIDRLDAIVSPSRDLHSQLARLVAAASLSVEVDGGARVLLPVRPKRFAAISSSLFEDGCISECRYSPSSDGVDENLLVLFHGYGEKSAASLLSFGQGMDLPQTAVLSLGGPAEVPLLPGHHGWFCGVDASTFELLPLDKPHKRRFEEASKLAKDLYVSIVRIAAARRIQLSNVQLLGYGDGGSLALQIALFAAASASGSSESDTGKMLPPSMQQLRRWAGCFGAVTSIGGPLLPEVIATAAASGGDRSLHPRCPTNILFMSAPLPGLSSSTAATKGKVLAAAKVCEDTVAALERLGFKREDPLVPPAAASGATSIPMPFPGDGPRSGTIRHYIFPPPMLLKGAASLPENPSSPPPIARMPKTREEMLPLMSLFASNLRRRMVGMESAGGFIELGR